MTRLRQLDWMSILKCWKKLIKSKIQPNVMRNMLIFKLG
ncbi:Uncharacterised protein [Mycobacterium tuberculosis]|nr:Uncharacterised protein [Mycobacterium tuberculosis]